MAQVNAGRVRFIGRGEYNNSTQYYTFDLVNYNGNSYFAKSNTMGNLPTNSTYWQLIAEKGNTGGVGPTGETGNGIASITKTSTSGLIDTYTITFTNGQTTTYQITNGANGSVVDVQVDGTSVVDNGIANIIGLTEMKQELEDMYNLLPKVSGTGETITLDGTVAGKMLVDLKGNTSQATSILPSEYTQVDYIESSGTQYINTGIKVSNLIRTEIKYKRASGLACLFGGRTDYQRNNYAYWTQADDNKIRDMFGPSTNTWSPDLIDENKIVVVDKNENVTSITVDGTTTTHTHNAITFNANYDIYLFGCNNAGNVMSQYIGGTIYYCKMYNNDVLVRDYIPCYRNSDNEVGLYDLVNNVFYTNAGTGTFTYGSTSVSLPSPDFPIPINVVSGDNSIDVCGKNLLKYPYDETTKTTGGVTFTDNGDGTIKISGTATANAYFNTYPNTTGKRLKLKAGTYTFSNDALLPSGITITFSPRDSEGNAISGVSAVYLNNTTKEATRTINQDFEIFSNILVSNGTAITTPITIKPMIEVGSTATEYEAYKGASYPINLRDIELCKIGDYQDSIVKDNGKWYLNKQIGKVVLNGSESWTKSSNTNVNRYYIPGTFINTILNVNTIDLISDYFTCITLTQSDAYNIGLAKLNDTSIMVNFSLSDTNFDTLQKFTTWLSTYNTIVYYVLKTPTYTEITDSTLLSQLEAVKRSFNGQTNISQENDDKPFILDVTALKELTQ